MRLVTGFPLLAIILILYNVIAFGSGNIFGQSIYDATMLSGAMLRITIADAVLLAGLFVLFIEVIKAASAGSTSTIIDHMLSTAVFIAGLVEFLLVPQAGTSIFLLLVAMCFIDVVAGYTITIISARRDVSLGSNAGGL